MTSKSWLKVTNVLIRMLIFIPAWMRLAQVLNVFVIPQAWFQPLIVFWRFPLFNGVFALLCIIPYFRFFFIRPAKHFFLLIHLITLAFVLRHQFLPFHYTAPNLDQYPAFRKDFEEAMSHPNGSGFESQQKQDGKLVWLVRKPSYNPESTTILTLFYLAPLALFFVRNAELQCSRLPLRHTLDSVNQGHSNNLKSDN